MEIVEELVAAGRQRPDADDAIAGGRYYLLHAQRTAFEFHGRAIEIFDVNG